MLLVTYSIFIASQNILLECFDFVSSHLVHTKNAFNHESITFCIL